MAVRRPDGGVLPDAHVPHDAHELLQFDVLAELRLGLLRVKRGLRIWPDLQQALVALLLEELDVPLRQLVVDVQEGLLVVLVDAHLLDRGQLVGVRLLGYDLPAAT
jgi:hypothetical protein